MTTNMLSVLILGVPALLGCGNGSAEGLRLTESERCPSGDATIELWCNNARDCEYRVVGGSTYPCSMGIMPTCEQAERDAVDECVTMSDTYACADLCDTCSAQQCEDCMDLESLARENDCGWELESEISCNRAHPCSPDVGACNSQHEAFVECACWTFLSDIEGATLDCGRPWIDRDCITDPERARVIACALELRANGCDALDTPECGNGL